MEHSNIRWKKLSFLLAIQSSLWLRGEAPCKQQPLDSQATSIHSVHCSNIQLQSLAASPQPQEQAQGAPAQPWLQLHQAQQGGKLWHCVQEDDSSVIPALHTEHTALLLFH